MTTNNSTPIWKKILICSLALLAISATVLTAYSVYEIRQNDYEKCKHESLEFINDEIAIRRFSKGYHPLYEQAFDRYTNEPLSDKFKWVATGSEEYDDSLVVYADMKGRRGYINLHTGKMIIKGTYQHAWNFSEGLAAVTIDNKVGFINENGEFVIPCQFPVSNYVIQRFGFAFHDSTCVMTDKDDLCGIINRKGEWVLEPKYDCIWNPNSAHKRIYQTEGKYGLLDVNGQIIIPAIYDDITDNGEYFRVIKDGIMSTMDYDLNIINPFVCTGTAAVYIQNSEYDYDDGDESEKTDYIKYYIWQREGIMDSHGKIIIPAKYYYIKMISEHLFKAQMYGTDDWIFIDTNGNIVH